MNLISGTHHLCERRKHAFMILWEYTIISRWGGLHLICAINGNSRNHQNANQTSPTTGRVLLMRYICNKIQTSIFEFIGLYIYIYIYYLPNCACLNIPWGTKFLSKLVWRETLQNSHISIFFFW